MQFYSFKVKTAQKVSSFVLSEFFCWVFCYFWMCVCFVITLTVFHFYISFGRAALWLALLHHSKKVLSSNLGSVEFTCSCYACVGPLGTPASSLTVESLTY